MNGPQIPRQDFAELMRQTEGDMRSTTHDPLHNVLLAPLKNVIDSAQNFGNCMKQCIVQQSAGGVCLEQFGYVACHIVRAGSSLGVNNRSGSALLSVFAKYLRHISQHLFAKIH